jgi:hypothetical protein
VFDIHVRAHRSARSPQAAIGLRPGQALDPGVASSPDPLRRPRCSFRPGAAAGTAGRARSRRTCSGSPESPWAAGRGQVDGALGDSIPGRDRPPGTGRLCAGTPGTAPTSTPAPPNRQHRIAGTDPDEGDLAIHGAGTRPTIFSPYSQEHCGTSLIGRAYDTSPPLLGPARRCRSSDSHCTSFPVQEEVVTWEWRRDGVPTMVKGRDMSRFDWTRHRDDWRKEDKRRKERENHGEHRERGNERRKDERH